MQRHRDGRRCSLLHGEAGIDDVDARVRAEEAGQAPEDMLEARRIARRDLVPLLYQAKHLLRLIGANRAFRGQWHDRAP